MIEAVWLAFAFVTGMAVRIIGLPPLIGYLAAGFALTALASSLHMPAGSGPILQHIAHLGVLLLLFTVGLKLKLRNLASTEILGSGLLHFAISTLLFSPAFY